MSLTGETINRADFQLLTNGFGPIGAPTMSLQELGGKRLDTNHVLIVGRPRLTMPDNA